jgi:hypothetical protein
MIATRPQAGPAVRRSDARRLVVTDYSRQQIACAIHESFVEALHVRFGSLEAEDRAWVREWLGTVVPRLTERTVNALGTQLEAALWDAPADLIDRLDERRQRARLGVE